MILHNILNRRGTLYLQLWDKRGRQEQPYAELPRTNEADDASEPPPLSSVTMWTKRDIIRDVLYMP
jgi:hypothetical protein